MCRPMQYLPIFVALSGQRAAVIGEGQMAEAKCRTLLKTAAQLTLYSETPTDTMLSWAAEGKLSLKQRKVSGEDFQGVRLVYAAHPEATENERVAALARAEGALVNVLDTPNECDFITPAIVDRDPVVVAIGTEGAAPVLARQIKADIEALLPGHLGRLARLASRFRDRAAGLAAGLPRRRFWQAFFQQSVPETGLSDVQVEALLSRLLVRHEAQSAPEGRVVFVGAGPGDPELLTIKARRLIHEADVIVHDRLVSAEILDLGRKEAKYVSVGKQGFGPSASQTDINAHLVREASQGLLVVRLKGGDPSVFGRLDEEIEALSEKGIEVSVVPGVTAAAAAAASLKVSLTRRHRNSSVTFLTAHDAHGFAEHDWQQLARSKQALAVYMGKRSAKFLQGRLLMHGLAADTPVTCIENVSLANERVMTSQLLGFAQAITEADCKGPLMILIGIQSDIGAAIADLVAQAPEFPAVSSGAL